MPSYDQVVVIRKILEILRILSVDSVRLNVKSARHTHRHTQLNHLSLHILVDLFNDQVYGT